MLKKFFLITLLLAAAFDVSSSETRIFGKIQLKENGLAVIHSLEGKSMPAMLERTDLKEALTSLHPGDDVIIDGYLTYVSSGVEGMFRPVFLITAMRPVSLSRLGAGLSPPEEESSRILMKPLVYSPLAIPVTAKVASSLTATGAVLLLQSLTASPFDPSLRREINSGLVIFAGLLSTSIFIFEQLTAPPGKGINND